MEATGVSFAEQQMRLGRYYDQPRFPFVPGYDVVGTVIATGTGVDARLEGRRFAAVTKIGAWSEYVDVDARALLDVPDALDPVDVETVIINGITAWRMLHEVARVPRGGSIVVLGANGGVGSTLVQLARTAGIRVIGTAAVRHHDLVRELGAEPVDSRDPAMYERLREVAPDGVDAVFDHVGGRGLSSSRSLVRRGGALVSYGTASTKNGRVNPNLLFLPLLARLAIWNALPDGRRASFFNFWEGLRRADAFYDAQRSAFTELMALMRSGDLRSQVAARFPLSETALALELAESRTVAGKVVIVPDAARR
jgi:NADPH2:quinone reductase